MTTPDSKRTVRSLLSDQRGAMVVVGTFMAVFLSAGLFYLVGTGEALIYRERIQDAADAVAYSTAGVHARGMNLIVLLNLIMAALLAVLIFAKTIKYLNLIILAICVVISWFVPPAAAYIPVGNAIDKAVSAFINVYENVLKVALPALNFSQIAIALATPWTAALKTGPDVQAKYEPLAETAYTISPSMMPQPAIGSWSDIKSPKALFDGFKNGKLGLPVQQDSYDNLCKKSAEMMMDLFADALGGNLFAKAVGRWASSLIGAFPSAFCGGGSSVDTNGFKINIGDIAASACKDLKKKKEQDYKDAHSGSTSGFSFDQDECEKDKKKELQDSVDDANSSGSSTGGGGSWTKYATPKKIFDGADIGGGQFQVWALLSGQEKWAGSNTEKGVGMASWHFGAPEIKRNFLNRYRFAQAEFYWDSPGSWDENKDQCMWKMRWASRLRRVRVDMPDILEGIAGPIFDNLLGSLKGKLFNALDGAGVKTILAAGGVSELLSSWLKDGIGFKFGTIDMKFDSWPGLMGLVGKADDALNKAVQGLLATPEIVH
ncbi:MAG: hypothetical protein R3B13_07795 [Polyangiaceae bacterium]